MKRGLLLGLLAFLASSLWIAWNAPPGTDEGWFASPAYNLIHHGHMGTSVLDPTGYILRPKLEGLETHTFWVLPANLVGQAMWYKAAGFGLLQMRLFSIAWGMLAVVATWIVVRRLTGDERAASLTAILLGFDLLFVHYGAMGRMDMMCLSLGLAGQAIYMILREKHFGWSLFASHALLAGAVLTHPNAVIPGAGLLFLQLALDWRRVRVGYVALAGAPYVLGFSAYWFYIAQAPDSFSAQIAANNVGGGRSYYLFHPVQAVLEEINRYRVYYGLTAEANARAWIKGFAPAVLFGGLLLQAARFRQLGRGEWLLLISGIMPMVILTFFNYKNAYYLIYAIPYLTANAVFGLFALWRKGRWQRGAVAAAIAVLLLVDVTTTVFRGQTMRARGKEYTEIADLLNPMLPGAGPRMMAPPEFAFIFGFDRVVQDDTLGFFSGRRTNLLIDTPFTNEENAEIGRRAPQVYAHRLKVLESEYEPLYRGAIYTVYRARKVEP